MEKIVLVQFGVLVLLALLTRAPARARRKLASGPGLRWWHWVVGLNGGLYLIVAAYATPRLGAVLVTVGIVGGQVAGGLVVDRIGLSPVGQQAITPFRLLGIALALAAVGIGAGGAAGELHLGLLALAVAAGAGTAVQQAALGHVARATGEPVLSGVINCTAAGIGIWIVALAVTGGTAQGGWSAPPQDWLAGPLGALILVLLAIGARAVGILRLMLAFVAGQTLGSLTVDLIDPPEGDGITALAVVGLVLTIAAVVVSGLGRKPTVRATQTAA